MILHAKIEHSSPIARLHSETLNNSFLASLGFIFLNKLYAFLIQTEKVWVYEENQEIKGFVSFSANSAGLMKRFIISCPMPILLLALRTIKHPSNFWRLVETFLAPFKSGKKRNKKDVLTLPQAELLSISVSPDCQASGVGSQLVNVLEQYLQQNQIYSYKVVAGEELVGANNFYVKNGFEFVKQIQVHGSKLSNVYVKEIR